MGNIVAQNASTDVVCGPFVNIYGSTIADLTIANNQIVIIKEGSVSVARSDAVSAASVGPGMQRISLNATDTNTMGTLTIWVSASAMMPYAKQIEVWQSTTWNMFYGSAEQILGSVAASVLVSTLVQRALTNYQAPTSATVSVIVKGVLTNADVATSTGTSAMVSALGSVIVNRALTNFDVLTSSGASVLVSGILNSYNVASVGDITGGGVDYASISGLITNALTNYQVMTSAGTSALISVVVKNALTLGDVATSTGMSAMVSTLGSTIVNRALVNYDVPTSADISTLAQMVVESVSSRVIIALSQWEVPSSANMSVIIQGALTNYDVPTSADISAIVPNAVWNKAGTEPTSAPDWGSVSRGTGFDWLLFRATNRHSQTTSTIAVYSSAGSKIASASVSNNSVSATRDHFLG